MIQNGSFIANCKSKWSSTHQSKGIEHQETQSAWPSFESACLCVWRWWNINLKFSKWGQNVTKDLQDVKFYEIINMMNLTAGKLGIGCGQSPDKLLFNLLRYDGESFPSSFFLFRAPGYSQIPHKQSYGLLQRCHTGHASYPIYPYSLLFRPPKDPLNKPVLSCSERVNKEVWRYICPKTCGIKSQVRKSRQIRSMDQRKERFWTTLSLPKWSFFL